MAKILRNRKRLWAVALLTLGTPGIAFAYIDPGTGAYVVQSIIAFFGIAFFYASHPIRLVKKLLNRWRDRSN